MSPRYAGLLAAMFGGAILGFFYGHNKNCNNCASTCDAVLDGQSPVAESTGPMPQVKEATIRDPFNASLKEYFRYRGFKYCERASEEKREKGLWAQLRSPASSDRCENIFQSWLNTSGGSGNPTEKIPPDLFGAYSLHGRARLSKMFLTDGGNLAAKPREWTFEHVEANVAIANVSGDFSYGHETQLVYRAVRKYNLTGKRGLVIGSIVPWLESILLAQGKVSEILTVEYHPINSTHPQIKYAHPIQFSEQWRSYAANKFDFAFTFSSIEHAGLGRYGDRLDPDGDLSETQKLSCVLADGALVFVGVPVGVDEVVWNAHRVYGRARLPLVTANFEVLELLTDPLLLNKTVDPLSLVLPFANSIVNHGIVAMRNVVSDPGGCD